MSARKNLTPGQKVGILREHRIVKVPVVLVIGLRRRLQQSQQRRNDYGVLQELDRPVE